MKVLSFFNNKGGVGKTTLTGNIAAYFSIEMNKRILVVDCDPQCNITQFILGDAKTIDLYWPDTTSKDNLKVRTVLDVVQPMLDGDASVNKTIRPITSSENRFQVALLPGHPRFSLFEDPLSAAWTELPSGKPGGFRVTNWLRAYLDSVSNQYDLVFVDVSPSLGALNRSVLLSSDYFVTPLGADAFSLLGIRNISRWMSSWIEYYLIGQEQSNRLNPGALEKYKIQKTAKIVNGYVGYTLQSYITKSKGGQRRATNAYERILSDLPLEVATYLSEFRSKPNLTTHLGDIPNLYSLIPLAQTANAPIISLKARDGLVGSQFSQAEAYRGMIGNLASAIAERIDF